MKFKKKVVRTVSIVLGAALSCGVMAAFAGCKKNTDALVIMTEELNGLFNPFFSTAGTDMDVVGQTQISMLSTNSEGKITYGDKEAVVVKDFEMKTEGTGSDSESVYYFVLKNGITFSDGKPLTMGDVLFNMYVYLDPAYTGSTTMYSTDIVGLADYRLQQHISGDGSSEEEALSSGANGRANNRVKELITVYENKNAALNGSAATTYDVSPDDMRDAIAAHTPSPGYKRAIAEDGVIDNDKARAQLLADYEQFLKLLEEELKTDFNSAGGAYTEPPYSTAQGITFDEITSFMYMEGYVTLKYELTSNGYDRSKIIGADKNYDTSIKTKEAAIKYVYTDMVSSQLQLVLNYSVSASTLFTNFVSKARDVILHEQLEGDSLIVSNIEGIKSLGHNTQETSVTVNGNTYAVAREHNADGTPKNASEYDVLRIRVKGVDPKAVWNFAFTVAPYHYYSNPSNSKLALDVANDKFGVEWGSFDFMTSVIQGVNQYGVSKNKVPLGAGPYIATNEKTESFDKVTATNFNTDNFVFYRRNESFLLGSPKIEKMRYQVVSSSNALMNLEKNQVHFISPQYTPANAEKLNQLRDKGGFDYKATWQLGYGYIGVNAGLVPDINLRKAIMSAMNTELALSYYIANTATTIAWPMSLVSWAYPRNPGTKLDPGNPLANKLDSNAHDYMMFPKAANNTPEARAAADEAAKTKIKNYMALTTYSDSDLTLRFTIAGSSLTEHPCYAVFEHAAELLNACGWHVEVMPDTNALTKLSTGSLAVWAAAWGSTIDPDMYQVYHKNSTATSTYSWGYREILANQTKYSTEYGILNELSKVIDDAREINDETRRTELYKTAMSYVLDLAVELPVYQRQTLYAYNNKVIDESTFPEEINSYSSPLGKIWEIDFKK